MASLTITDTELQLKLTRREKVAALHGDVQVPISAVRDVSVAEDALSAVRGLRAPGLNLPGRTKIGTWRGRGRRQFAVARRGEPAVHVFLSGAQFDELIVSTPSAAAIVEAHAQRG
jgi:uncharacterized protein